jgi:hypothetical protein
MNDCCVMVRSEPTVTFLQIVAPSLAAIRSTTALENGPGELPVVA